MSTIHTATSKAPAEPRPSRRAWLEASLGHPVAERVPASSDASFRSYWRLGVDGDSRILMDAPPSHEDIRPWLDIAERLARAGLRAPRVMAASAEHGYVLMDDLGTRTLLPELDARSVDRHYASAIDTLLTMQASVTTAGLPDYDEQWLVAEMELLPEWFLRRHLGFTPECEQWDVIESAFRALATAALSQPRVFVHRDFHSRNLMLVEDELGLIDFQDAVRGPVTYDLVSLLRDCYVEWPEARVDGWVEDFRRRAEETGMLSADRDTFRRWFDLMGLQRHIKVLGIFCRLWYRDGKPGYLNDLPLVWRYTRTVGQRYPEIAPLIELIESVLADRDITRPRALGE